MFSWIFTDSSQKSGQKNSGSKEPTDKEFRADWELLGRPATQILNEIKDDFDDNKVNDDNTNKLDTLDTLDKSGESEKIEKEDLKPQSTLKMEDNNNNKPVSVKKRRSRRRRGNKNSPSISKDSNNNNKENNNDTNIGDNKDETYATIAKRKQGLNFNINGTLSDEEKTTISSKQNNNNNNFNNNLAINAQDTFDRSYYVRKSGSSRNKKVLKQQKLKEKFLSKRAHREIKKEIKRRQRPQYGLYN